MANTVKPKTWEEFKKSAGKSSASSSWKEFKEKALPKAAKHDAKLIETNLPNYSQSFYDSQYKMGGSADIKGSGVIPMFGQYGKYAPIASDNLAAGVDYLGMTDEELDKHQKALLDAEKESLYNYNSAIARTGGLSSIDTSGMKKSEVKELGRMDYLSRFDDTHELQQQFSSRDEAEAAGVDIYGGMSEKEYTEQLMAHYREQLREKMAGAEAKRFNDQANELAASVQGDGKYVPGKAYWRSLDRGLLNSGMNEFNIDGEVLSYDEYLNKAEKSYINDYMGAVLNDDEDAIIELMDVGSAFPELQRKFSIDALAYADKDQAKTAINFINNDDMDGLYNYLGKIDYDISKDMVTDWNENAAEWANKSVGNQILGTIASFPMNLVGGIYGAADDVAGLLENFEWYKNIVGEDVHSQANAGRVLLGMSDIYRGEMGQTIAEATPFLDYGNDKNLANTAFQGLASLGDSLLSMTGGPVLQTVSMFGQEAGRTLYEQQDKGNNRAALYATGVGVISAAMEKFGLDSLFKGNLKKAVLGNAAEEGLTEIASSIYDIIVNGNNSEYNTLVDQYRIYGYGDKAGFKAALDKALDTAEAALGGMFAGLAGGTPDAISARNEGKRIRTNEGMESLASLAETVPVSRVVKAIVERMKAEVTESKKGAKGETATEDKTSITKEEAAVEAQESEMAERDRAERAGEMKETAEIEEVGDNPYVPEYIKKQYSKKYNKQYEKEQERHRKQREKEALRQERADEVKSDGTTVDAASITKRYAETVKNREQTARDRMEKADKKKPVSNAEIGYVYREVMRNLDKGAQQTVTESFSRDVVESALASSGYRGDMRWAADVVTKFINGNTGKNIIKALESNEVVRQVALDFMGDVQAIRAEYRSKADNIAQRASKDFVKPETTKAEKGAQEATQGIDDRAAITEADVEISEEAESTVDGKAVTIEGVAKVAEDGSVTYNVKDADGNVTEVAAADIAYGQNDGDVARLVAMAKDLGRNAETLIKSYAEGQDVYEYAAAFKQAMQYGEDGRNIDVVKGYSDMQSLNEGQIAAAYELGRGIRTQRNNAPVRKNVSGIKVGRVDTSGVDFKSLTKHQRTAMHTMSRFAKIAGFNIKFVESKANAEGKYTTENGSWGPETLTLTLDVHAGSNKKSDVNYAMMHTAGHELTHFIKQFADTGLWNAYQDFVIGHLSTKEDGVFNLEDRINKQIEGARRKGRELTRDGAIEEIIANASGEALNSITEADIQALAETNPSLLNKIKQFFQKWIKSIKTAIKAAYSDTEAKTAEAKLMMDAVDEMGKRWNEMLVNAVKNKAVASEATIEGVELSESGETAYAGTDLLYDLRTFNESDYVTERDKAAAALAKKMGITAEKAEAYIDDVTSIAAMVAADRDRLDFEAENEYTALKHNSEYKFTVDFSTLCKKRLLYTGTFDAIQKQMPETALTEDDYIRLRQMMADRGYEVACAFCYVESRRKNNGEIINKFLDVYKEAQKTGGQMELGPSNRRKAFKVEDGFTPNIADFNTSEGIANIMHNHRDVYDAYMYFMNARGVSKPKLIESRTAYSSEILKKFKSASAVRAMNKRGGLRLQSFSDFEVVNMLDMMQVVMDMSRVGLMSQAYTKVPAFARVFGGSGVKINLSLVTKGVDKNGKLIFDDIEGMPHEEAFKIRDMYSEHVGTILVGKDDATIKAAMADPRIDFIIPYHASGWSTENQNALGIGGYTNFTAGQNETNAATGKGVKNFQPSEYWDYSKTGDENAQIYLEKCREAGRVPKFPQYQNYPGYWKMLIDFKMYDNEGNGSPQRAVRPDYNLSEANRIMKEYTGGHQNLPVAHDVVRDFVKEYEGKQDGKKYSDRDAEYQDAHDDYDEPKAREMVREAAIAAGYNPQLLYHGTMSFGFTEIDPKKSDDGISFFTTTDDNVAETYAGKDARIRRIGSGGMTVDKLLAADGETLLPLLKKHISDDYELVSREEARELAQDEGELIRKRCIWKAQSYKDEHPELFGNEKATQAFDKVVDAMDRMSYSKDYEFLNYRYIAYDDALKELAKVNQDAASGLRYALADDLYTRYSNMQMFLGGDLFKQEGDWTTEYTYRSNAIDMLMLKMFKGIYELYGKTDNLLDVNAYGGSWNRIDGSIIGQKGYVTTREVSAYAKAHGYDGVYFHDIVDVGGMVNYSAASDVLTFFNPEDVKSADPFTYDDDGNLIPLSQRFDRSKSDIKYSLRDYTDDQKANWKGSKKIVLYENDQQALEFVESAIKEKNVDKKLYFGMVPEALAERINREAGYKRDLTGFNVCIHAKEIRKIFKDHGDSEKEKLRGQRAVTSEDIVRIPVTIEQADTIKMSETGYWGMDAIEFTKNVDGSRVTIIGAVSDGKLDLFVQTMYAGIKKENLADAADEQASANTPKATYGTVLDTSLSQNPEFGKSQMRDYDEISDRELLVRALETELTPAERDHLERYKKKVEGLGADQTRMEELTSRIVELRKAGYTARTSEELRAAETNVATLRKRIDRKDKELKGIESADMIREIVRRNRAEARKAAYALARQRADKRQREAVEHAREVGERRVQRMKESQAKEKYRKQILGDVKKLHSWVASPTNKGSVPEFLREPLAEFIDSIDFSSVRALRGGDPTKKEQKFAEALDKVREAVSRLNKQYSGLDKGAEAFEKFIDLPADYADEFDALVSDIKAIMKHGGSMTDTPFNMMSGQQLKEMAKMFRILKSSIQSVNRFVANARYESARQAANDTIDDTNDLKARIKTNKALELLNSTFNWKNTTPYYVFQRLGRGGKAVFEGLQDGWDRMARNSALLIEFAKGSFTAAESKAWSGEITEVTLDSEDTIQMTTAQKMSLYCHTKREQSRGHLMGGGIRVSDIDGKRGTKISQAEDYVLTEDDIARIIDSLTDRQREVADKLQAFMNDQCAKWGNEISMKRFGFEQMTEKNYFPIKTDSNNRASIDESKEGSNSMFRLLNMSSLKPLTPGANNAIIIEDIFNVFSDHASDMAKYNALALPILDFIKWYNYVEKNNITDEDGNPTGKYTTRSTQKALERAFGKDAKSYLTTFVKDLNAEHDGGRDDHIINRLTNRAKLASVGANMRVYLLQITSAPRAAYAIKTKYLLKGVAGLKNKAEVGEKAKDKVGILQWKDLGFFSTDINRSVRTMVRQDESNWDKARNLQMAPASWGDALTANIIFNAVKAEMRSEHPTVKPGTDAYDQMVNRRVREIVYKTQVVDSTMTRSQLMRSKGVMSMFTSFMSEPTLTVNMLNESIQEVIYRKRGGKLDENDLKPGKKAAKAWSAFIVCGIASTLVASVMDAFRDDDEYETFLEKYLSAMANNAIDAVNIPGMLPILSDFSDAVMQAIKGNDFAPTSLAYQTLTNTVETVNGLREYFDGKRTLTNVIYSALKTFSYGSGYGMYNAVRDAAAVYNTVIANGTTLPKIQNWRDSKKKAAEAMYEAALAHDTETFDHLTERALLYGIESEDLESAYINLISDDYLAGQIDATAAKRMIQMYGGKTPYQAQTALDKLNYQAESGEKLSDIEKNYVTGKTDKAAAKAALTKYGDMTTDEADAKILTWDYEKDAGRKYSDISNAYIRGEIKRSEIKNAMIKYGGKSNGEAEKTVLKLDYQIKTERPWSDLMKDYHKGRFTSGQVKKFLMDYDGKDEAEAADIVDKYDWAKANGGSTDGYSKYVSVHEAIDNGRGLDEAVEALVAKYTARGKTRKEVLSDIRASITSKYKPIYLAASKAEQAQMRKELLDVYVKLGGNYNTYYKNMTDKWFED